MVPLIRGGMANFAAADKVATATATTTTANSAATTASNVAAAAVGAAAAVDPNDVGFGDIVKFSATGWGGAGLVDGFSAGVVQSLGAEVDPTLGGSALSKN